jgi:hypothetical protein
MTAARNDGDLSELMPGLMKSPLWEGEDAEFSEYVHATLGIDTDIRAITITPLMPSGRCAVAIGHRQKGAIVFVMTHDRAMGKVHIAPTLMGPVSDDANVVRCAEASDGRANMNAVMALALRHLPEATVFAMFTPPAIH